MSENNTMIFTLTFDLAGGSGEFYAVTGEASSYYQLPANAPSRPGYGFMGWKNSANITFQPGGDYYFSYGNDTLTAVWEPIERTLTFNLAGGTGEFNAITGLEGESIYLGNMPIREGYYFSRWVNSVGESFCPGDTYTFNYGNDTLTAVWGSTVTFDLNGGEGNFPDISGEVMTSLMLPSEIPTKAGYNFVKWVSDKHGDNYLEYGYFIDGNDTFTAVWEIAWYTLTYNLSDADTPESIESQEGQAETNIILSDIVPTKEGFTFVRWENTAGEKFQPGAPYFFGYHDDTLTPVWGYTVTLDFSDGRTEVVKGGVGETLDFIPTSEYGTFYSWINKNSQEFLPGEYTFIHGDDYLSAMWGYTVSYDTNGGVGEFSPQTTLFGGTITIPTVTPTKDGYEFREWISTAGESFYPGATYDKNEPTILTADWMCNLYFDTDGGDEGSYLISALSEGEVFELPTPTRSNYTFVKWVNSQGVEFYPEDEYRLIYGHDTLTAVWGYTVTLDASGGECVESVIKPVGEALDIVPEYEGYNFSHWINKNGDRFDSSNPYTFEYGDDTLTAHWKYEVICLNEDGSVFDRLSADKDSNITLSTEIPTLFNHVFLHWLVQGTNNVFMPGKEFNLNRNATLVPQWRKMYILTFFDCDGDHFRIEDKYEGVDIEIQDEAPWCSGQDFVCWKIRFGNEYYFIGDIYKKDTDTGFEPIMIAEGRAAVVFDLAGGEGDISPIDFIPNEESFTVPSEIPVRLGYHFLFWTEKGVTDENENIVKYYPNATYDTVTETKRLTAVWERDKHGAYEAHNVGNKVQECVNLKTGNLTLDINDVEWQGNRLPVSVSHHYDGAFAGYKYTSGVADVNCADFSAMNCGLGFRLNLMQSMKEASVLHPDGTVSQYVFTDGNGDETYFVPFENGESVEYREKDGANITYEPSTRTMKWDNDEYIFDTSGRLVTYIDEYENSLNYHYSMGRLTAVVDGVGRIFTLNYQGGNLISVTAPDGTSVRYEYSGELLTKIIYPDNSYLLFTYASSNRISKVTMFANGDAAVIAKTYQYSNKRVSFIREYDSLNDDGKIYYYVYNEAGNTTTVSIISRDDREDDYTSEAFDTVYVFNPDGSISGQHMSVLDENGDEVLPKRTLLSVSEDMVARTENSTVNLLANHTGSFGNTDGIASGWTLYNGCTSAEFIEDESKTKYSTKYLEIKSSADGYIGQQYILAPGSYTFSAYVRLIAPSAQDNSGIALKVLDSNGNTVSSTEYIDRNDGVYTRLATSFDITETSTMNLCICLRGITEAYVNAHQLEKNTTATAYNMLENPSFEFYSGGTILSWSRISYASRATANHFDGASSLKAQSAESTVRYAYQDVKVKTSPSTRETFTLSGWCKATSYRKENEDSLCRLRAEIYYNDGTEPEEYTADFQPNVADWQYTEVTFSKSRFAEVSKVRVWCELGNTTGIAYFDAISLTREYLETGLTREDFEGYEVNANTTNSEETESEDTFSEAVDIYGNRVTETDISEEGTIYRSFEYGNNGNDLVAETDARGNKVTYTVDPVTSRNTAVTDRMGNKTTYEYDSLGRVTKVKSLNSNSSVEYAYNTLDNMTEIVRGDGMKYVLGYDYYGNLQSIGIDGKSDKLIKYTYRDKNGRLKKIIYANGDYIRLGYDRLGNMSFEKWFDAEDNPTHEYVYVYSCDGHIVKTIDKTGLKEYNYTYDEGNLVRAVEYDVTFTSDVVTSKTRVVTISYVYTDEGELLKKRAIFDNGSESTRVPARDADSSQFYSNASGTADFVTSSETDGLGRKTKDYFVTTSGRIERSFTYHDGEVTPEHVRYGKVKSGATTELVDKITYLDGRTTEYEYDAEERITKVTDSIDGITEYTYDSLGQLLTEKRNGVVINSMTYDGYGNIKSKNGSIYTYGNSTWKDLLTYCKGKAITYDAQGNPTSYMGNTLVWEKGRQLKSFGTNSYTYNANGIRTSKTVNGVKHTYILDGTKILKETWDTNTIVPLYDNEDSVCGISFNCNAYYFIKNLQGDVIALAAANKTIVARYTYDAWGVCTVTDAEGNENTTSSFIGNVNPFRYRGYYYDVETGLYYLQSRYYDAEVGRFVSGDEAVFSVYGCYILEHNLYSYCANDPIRHFDPSGRFWLVITIITIAYVANNHSHKAHNKANSPSGFIYDQNSPPAANLKFGFYDSSKNGCGWIATYNALILLGEKPKAEDIISEYEKCGAILYGTFGVDPLAITKYFLKRGYKVSITFDPDKIDSVAKKHTCNILFYAYWVGGHYVALHWDGENYLVYNYKEPERAYKFNHKLSEEFNNKKRAFGTMISISKK